MNDTLETVPTDIAQVNPQSTFKNITGQKFGRLTVVGIVGRIGKRKRLGWLCRCDCGNTTILEGIAIRYGSTKSCGCIKKENDQTGKLVHGHCQGKHTPEYTAWRSMKQRCLCPNARSFKHYGGRGIKICDRWLESFENFLADMGTKPTPGHSLGRRDNNAGYSPENCSWENPIQQHNNTRVNVRLLSNGKNLTYAEWSRETGIHRDVLMWRIKNGWTIERALNAPMKPDKRRAAKVSHSVA